MIRILRSPAFRTALIALALALCFLGTRGIWDPDEGRYTNVALNMLHSGDWLNPHRHHEVGHWTKPPLTYWAIAASVGAFGANPWAARLPSALSYLFCVWLAWRIGKRLAPGSEHAAALIYATMLLTVGASQMITTDYLLTAWETLGLWAFVETRFGDRGRPRRWIALMWAAFALAFLTKGPPGLLPLLVVLAFDALMPGLRRHRVLQWSGVVLFVLLALPWYVAVIHGNPGLFQYFIGDEVVNRITTNEFGRHGEWYGWITVYLPTLLLGTLPWTPALLRWARGMPGAVRRWWRDPAAREAEAPWLLLALWVSLPLLVFCVSKSRMPLYVLPLFMPLALLAALQRRSENRGLPHWRWLALWALALLAIELGSAYWPTHKNAEQWADAIRERATGPVHEIVFVEDMARYGLHLEMGVGTEIEKISQDQVRESPFDPQFDESLAVELAEDEPNQIWVCKQDYWPSLQKRLAEKGFRAIPLGTPYQRRIIFKVERNAMH